MLHERRRITAETAAALATNFKRIRVLLNLQNFFDLEVTAFWQDSKKERQVHPELCTRVLNCSRGPT